MLSVSWFAFCMRCSSSLCRMLCKWLYVVHICYTCSLRYKHMARHKHTVQIRFVTLASVAGSSLNQNRPIGHNLRVMLLLSLWAKKGATLFLPCDCEAYARYCCQDSVCLSVRLSIHLSVKRVYCDKTKAPSEKSSMTNRKSPTSFPMSLRWTSYVAPNPPSPQRGPQKRKFDQ